MKKFTLLIITILFCVLLPTSTLAQGSRLVAVRYAGGPCNGLVTFEVDYASAGGAGRINIEILGNGLVDRGIRYYSGNPHSATVSFQLDSSGKVIGGAVLRIRVGINGQWREYFFDCQNREFSRQTTTANNDFYGSLQRQSSVDLNVLRNDASELPFRRIQIVTPPYNSDRGTVTVTDDNFIRLTTGDFIGTTTFVYRVCNIAGNCDTATVWFTTVNSAPTCDAVLDDTIYFWPRSVLTAPFIGVDGVTDPDGDALVVQITAITVVGDAGNSTLYSIEFTVTDIPPIRGTPFTCSGTALVQKE